MAGWRNDIPDPGRRNRSSDPRFNAHYPGVGGRLFRGKIVNIPGDLDTSTEMDHTFHFLVNPSEISLNYNTDVAFDMTLEENQSSLFLNVPPPLQDGLISISFSVLLDRTYEVWSNEIPEGVLHDIVMLERVLGVPDTYFRNAQPSPVTGRLQYGGPGSGNPHSAVTSGLARNRFPGIIVKRPVKVYFGGKPSYNFTGYVTTLSVQMMKFTRKMTPVRAGLSVSMSTWGDAPSGEGAIDYGSVSDTSPPVRPGRPSGGGTAAFFE